MEKERVVVNDTNVFIDLYSIGLQHKVLTPAIAADKLEQLYSINHRLPKSEIDLRIKRWRGSL